MKVRALLADLLIHDGRPVSADRLIEDLWGDAPPRDPVHALHTKVSQLRRALDQAEPGARQLVSRQAGGYRVRLDDGALDAARFRALAARAGATGDRRTRSVLLNDALALWRGPALADFADAEFALAAAAQLEEERLAALEDQAEARLDLGEHSLLAAQLSDDVAAHPLRERLRGLHMQALYRSGRQAEALDSHRRLQRLLADELGVDPGPEITALHQAILEQDPGLVDAPARPIVPLRRRTNLSAPLTGLIGRAEELARIHSLLESCRLVTLTGPGGVGKTRLAVEAARDQVDGRPDGVWLLELAGLRRPGPGATPDVIVDVVAATLGLLPEAGGEPETNPVVALADALRTKDMLLVLDNCEHVVEPVVLMVDELLRAAPAVRVIATSQEPLGLPGEVLVRVPTLAMPTQRDGTPVALQAFAAVQLFVARATAAAPGFTLNADTAPAVAVVCRRLDGLPLALELAATRVRTLGVRELAARIDDRFRLLTTGHRAAPSRQRTLRAMIEWTWDLLNETERTVLRRIAVCADGCTLESAEELCASGDVRGDDVLDLLGSLVDRSLVTMIETDTGPRYRLLESIAAFGLERLGDVGELAMLRERHLSHYTALAERAEPHLRGHDQRHWLRRLDAESANLRAALDEALRSGAADPVLRLVNALAWYWHLRARYAEGRRSLDAALRLDGDPRAMAQALAWRTGLASAEGTVTDWQAEARAVLAAFDDLDDPLGRARAEWFLGVNLIGDGDPRGKQILVDRALEAFRARGDAWGVAAALSTRALHALLGDDLAAAGRDGEESLRRFRDLGDSWGLLQAGDSVAMLAEITGDYERAARLHREALRMAEDLDLWIEVSWRLAQLGRISLLTGDHDRADEFHDRARRLAAQQGYRAVEMFAEVGLALGARRRGDLNAATEQLVHWLDWLPPDDPMAALILAELGFIAELRGDGERATALHRDGYAIARGNPRAAALAMEGLAGASALRGHERRAARLLGAAAAAREAVGAPLPPAERGDIDRISKAARAALGPERYSAAHDEGRTADPDDLVACAT